MTSANLLSDAPVGARTKVVIRHWHRVVIAAASLAPVWWALEWVLATEPPSATVAWGFSRGWHSGPLFGLVGHHVAAFRTLAVLVIVAVPVLLVAVRAEAVGRSFLSDEVLVRRRCRSAGKESIQRWRLIELWRPR